MLEKPGVGFPQAVYGADLIVGFFPLQRKSILAQAVGIG